MYISELKLAKELIRKPSITPKDAGAINLLAKNLRSLGFNCKLINFKKFQKDVKNIKISSKRKISSLVLHLKNLLEKKSFFVPNEKKHSMLMNINNLIYRLEPSDKELRILASIISSLSKKNINHN